MMYIFFLLSLVSSVDIIFAMEQEKIVLAQKLSNKSLKVNDYIISMPSAYTALKKEVSMHDGMLSDRLAAINESGIALLHRFNDSNCRSGKKAYLLQFRISSTSIFNTMHKKDLTQGYALNAPCFTYTEILLGINESCVVDCSYVIEHADPQSTTYPLLWRYANLAPAKKSSIKIPKKDDKSFFLMPGNIIYIELYYGHNRLSDWIRVESFYE